MEGVLRFELVHTIFTENVGVGGLRGAQGNGVQGLVMAKHLGVTNYNLVAALSLDL